jgi:hypothetical protein
MCLSSSYPWRVIVFLLNMNEQFETWGLQAVQKFKNFSVKM